MCYIGAASMDSLVLQLLTISVVFLEDNQHTIGPEEGSSLPLTQYGHKRCARFGSPQPEHLLMLVTSLSPFPAICLCLFFMWEVFFFGTARSIESQISDRISGTLRLNGAGRLTPAAINSPLCRTLKPTTFEASGDNAEKDCGRRDAGRNI